MTLSLKCLNILSLFVISTLTASVPAPVMADTQPATLAKAETPQAPTATNYEDVLTTMDSELKRSMSRLAHAGKAPIYYLAYRLYEGNWNTISASNGALLNWFDNGNWRMLSVELRVGNQHMDNTHFLRGKNSTSPAAWEKSSKLDSNLNNYGAGLPLQECIWLSTDRAFRTAQQRYSELEAGNAVMSAEDDKSDDFSFQPVHHFTPPFKEFQLNRSEWEGRVRRLSLQFLNYPWLQSSKVSLMIEPTTRYMVNSEGSQIVEQHFAYHVLIDASTLAADGMQLRLDDSESTVDPSLLPDEAAISKRIEKLADRLDKLRNAPVAEAYVGPAILSGRAAAVFFHETFGHRIEAVHEKSENEGKTFARKIGTIVMPSFLTVTDDPTVAKVGPEYLNGHYAYDDEGVPAQAVTVAKNGVLSSFLLGRTMVSGFTASNGHGRSSPGWNPVARQGNLFVLAEKKKQVSTKTLREMLLQECKKQNKSYGLLFDEIAGGSTSTLSHSDQSYVVHPLVVYKVFVDGRPDQLIRGAEIVGTPLAALERIVAAGNDPSVFNGTCGRESGPVPVSAISPSLLVESIETKRKARSTQKKPVLPDPNLPVKEVGQAHAPASKVDSASAPSEKAAP